jgi:hypothetical protein
LRIDTLLSAINSFSDYFFFENMYQKILLFISRLEYTHKHEITDMCFDAKYLIILYNMFI